jgi:hypothetical protein
MDQTNGRHIVSKEGLQGRMDDTRHSMAETMGEIKHELSEAVEWKTYVQRHPGTCLLAGGALGWMLGRGLRSFRKSPLSSSQPQPPTQPSASAGKVVSAVLAEALPLIAAKMRRFSDMPDKE